MTDTKTLLQSAARCRRMAARSATEAIARKFLALAQDYEEHARRAEKGVVIIDLNGPDQEAPRTPLAAAHAKAG
ncbi:MAG: hypothetical protein K2Y27_28400 [Xanthobacteraceae bacterium]|nr:hypothetical protein [Xanthobacteraceae bacterium]